MDLGGPPAPRGSTISVYLADGKPGGIRVVEKDNWSGIGVDCARVDLGRARQREELQGSGIYLLVGNEGDPGSLPTVYVGESEDVSKRLVGHASKEFWNRAVMFTSKDGNLNKAHVKYLEARLLAIAKRAKNSNLYNEGTSNLSRLSDSDRDLCESYLAELLIVLPSVGITAFRLPDPGESSTEATLHLSTGAKGLEISEGFKVFKGSTAKLKSVDSAPSWVRNLREELRENRVLEETNQALRLTQDYIFDSPSAAAAALLGRSANGRTEWKTKDGKTLRQVQQDAE